MVAIIRERKGLPCSSYYLQFFYPDSAYTFC